MTKIIIPLCVTNRYKRMKRISEVNGTKKRGTIGTIVSGYDTFFILVVL